MLFSFFHSFFFFFIFKFRFGATVFASLRSRVKTTFYDLYCLYFSPEVMSS